MQISFSCILYFSCVYMHKKSKHPGVFTSLYTLPFKCSMHTNTPLHKRVKLLSTKLQDRESFRGCFKCTTVSRPSDKEEFLIPGRSLLVYEQDFCILIG